MSRSKNRNRHIHTSSLRRVSRREFLAGMGAAATFTIVPRHVLGGEGKVAASEKTTLACIGLGGQGHIDLFNLLKYDELQVTAVCDVHRQGSGYISWDWMKGKMWLCAHTDKFRSSISIPSHIGIWGQN